MPAYQKWLMRSSHQGTPINTCAFYAAFWVGIWAEEVLVCTFNLLIYIYILLSVICIYYFFCWIRNWAHWTHLNSLNLLNSLNSLHKFGKFCVPPSSGLILAFQYHDTTKSVEEYWDVPSKFLTLKGAAGLTFWPFPIPNITYQFKVFEISVYVYNCYP